MLCPLPGPQSSETAGAGGNRDGTAEGKVKNCCHSIVDLHALSHVHVK